MAELQGLGAQLSEAEQAGVEIVAISPDSNEKSHKGGGGPPPTPPSPPACFAGGPRRYGLIHSAGGPNGEDVPKPATIVVDRNGTVRWFKGAPNFQGRPDPGAVVRVV